MPLYLDVHTIDGGVSVDDVAKAHLADQQTEGKYDVRYLRYCFINDYRIVAVTPQRIVVLDAGKSSMKKAKGIVTELPRSARLGNGSGAWHVVPAGQEKLRVHPRFFKDLQEAAMNVAA